MINSCLLVILSDLASPLQLEKNSAEGEEVYNTLTEIFRLVLQDMRRIAMENEAIQDVLVLYSD